MKTLQRIARALALTDGDGLGAAGAKSWGGCPDRAELQRPSDKTPHVCEGHKADQQGWQHRCRCGFRWAA
jgi:hypothetical protein